MSKQLEPGKRYVILERVDGNITAEYVGEAYGACMFKNLNQDPLHYVESMLPEYAGCYPFARCEYKEV